MKRVLLLNTAHPHIWGGAEALAENLQLHIQRAGHKVETIKLPFNDYPVENLVCQMMAWDSVKLPPADIVIGLKFPAYLAKHENKKIWLIHQYRQVYDFYEAGQSAWMQNENGANARAMVIEADNQTMTSCNEIYTISEVTQQRLKKYNDKHAVLLRHPINDPEIFGGGVPQGYIFAGGRINSTKRQLMLVEAAAQLPRGARLVVAGPPDNPASADVLTKLVSKHGLEDRVVLDFRFLTRAEYADYMNNCTAAAYIPYDEDSIGYVTMEAAQAGKPLITTDDSGGVCNFVEDGISGWVTPPHVDKIAKSMAFALAQGTEAKQRGVAAKQKLDDLGINWPNVVSTLLK